MNENLNERLNLNGKEDKIIFIDFFASWCGPCKAQDPIIEELKSKFEKIVDFKKVDVNKDEELSDKYNVQEIPTLIIEKNGKLLARYVGVTNIYILEKKLKEIIGKRH